MSDYGDYSTSVGEPDFIKDPDSTEDYAFNWAPELNGDTISTSSFLLPDGLTQVSSTSSGTRTQIFVTGGTEGELYRITNRIVTIGGRTFDKTVRIQILER